MHIFSSPQIYIDVTIGFEQPLYTIPEDNGTVEVCVVIVRGTIGPGQTVNVMFETRAGSAFGKYSLYFH